MPNPVPVGALFVFIVVYVTSIWSAENAGYQRRVKEEKKKRLECEGFNKFLALCRAVGEYCNDLQDKNCGDDELNEEDITPENYPGLQAMLNDGHISDPEGQARSFIAEIIQSNPDEWLGDPEPIEEGGGEPLEYGG